MTRPKLALRVGATYECRDGGTARVICVDMAGASPRYCIALKAVRDKNGDVTEHVFHYAPDGTTGDIEQARDLIREIEPVSPFPGSNRRVRLGLDEGLMQPPPQEGSREAMVVHFRGLGWQEIRLPSERVVWVSTEEQVFTESKMWEVYREFLARQRPEPQVRDKTPPAHRVERFSAAQTLPTDWTMVLIDMHLGRRIRVINRSRNGWGTVWVFDAMISRPDGDWDHHLIEERSSEEAMAFARALIKTQVLKELIGVADALDAEAEPDSVALPQATTTLGRNEALPFNGVSVHGQTYRGIRFVVSLRDSVSCPAGGHDVLIRRREADDWHYYALEYASRHYAIGQALRIIRESPLWRFECDVEWPTGEDYGDGDGDDDGYNPF